MRITLAVVMLATLGLAGCGEYDPLDQPRGRSAAPEAVGVVVDPYSMGEPAKKPAQGAASKTAGPGTPAPTERRGPVFDGTVPPRQGMVREKAASGAGKKGHYGPGLIKTPLASYWRAKERITYEAQVTYPLKLYKAQHGHFPKTLDEFVEEILKPNRVVLPELPEGHRYVYDPEKGELQVEHPR